MDRTTVTVIRRPARAGDRASDSRGVRLVQVSTKHPCFVVRGRSDLKRHWPKLTVFGVAGQPFGNIDGGFLTRLCWHVTAVTAVNVGQLVERGLTARKRVSTLEQSPESRRYGSEPGKVSGYAPVSNRDEELTNGHRVQSDDRADGAGACGRQDEERFAVAKGKRTFQPNNRRRARVHGFRLRMRTRAGRAIVSNRRRKGRRSLTA